MNHGPGLRNASSEVLDQLLGRSVEYPSVVRFSGRQRRRRDRSAVTRRVLYPAIERANELLAERQLPAISEDVTFHSLRRTYATLAAEAGIDPAWTAAQIGHKRSRFTLDVYTDVGNRRNAPAERIGELIRTSEAGITAVKAETPSAVGSSDADGDGSEAGKSRTAAVNSTTAGA